MTIHEKAISLCAGAVIALSGAASAADGPVGNIELNGNTLSVTPAVSYAELQVTISGETVYWQKKYGPSEPVNASFAEIGALPDGSYKYEVIASPAVDEAAWAEAEGNAALEIKLEAEENAKTHVQFGGFKAVGGAAEQESAASLDQAINTLNNEEFDHETNNQQ